jgi:hypothetical protein
LIIAFSFHTGFCDSGACADMVKGTLYLFQNYGGPFRMGIGDEELTEMLLAYQTDQGGDSF